MHMQAGIGDVHVHNNVHFALILDRFEWMIGQTTRSLFTSHLKDHLKHATPNAAGSVMRDNLVQGR